MSEEGTLVRAVVGDFGVYWPFVQNLHYFSPMFYSHDSKRSLSRTSLFFVLLLGLTLTQGVLHAQPLKFQAGPTTDIDLDNDKFRIIGRYKETFLVICPTQGPEFTLAIFDQKLKLISNLEIDFPKDIKLIHRLQNAWLVDGKLILLTHCYNQSIKQDQYNLWQLSEAGILIKGPVEIARQPGNGIVVEPQDQPVISSTLDGKALFGITRTVAAYGQSVTGIDIKIFDSELEKINHKIINYPAENKSARVGATEMQKENLGCLVMDFETIPKPGTKGNQVKIPDFRICTFDLAAILPKLLPINTEELPFVHGVKATWSRNKKDLMVVSCLSSSHKLGIQNILIQRFNPSDSTPSKTLTFQIPPSFKKAADLNNKKFRDTGTPKRTLKEVMDLETQIIELDDQRFTIYASIERVNRQVPTGEKPNRVEDRKAIYTYYSQGNLILNGTWADGIYHYYENPMNHSIVPKNSPSPHGINGIPHFDNNLMVYNDLLENMRSRDENFKCLNVNEDNVIESKSVLLHIDPRGRFNFHLPFADPTDAVRIYPKSVFRNSAGEFIFLGCNHKCKLRLIKAAY